MTWTRDHRMLVAAVVTGLALLFLPATGAAETAKWLDDITILMNDHRDLAKLEGKDAAYDDYFGQIAVIRNALRFGDEKGVYVGMNKLMDMLEKNPGSIPAWSAKALFDYCGAVTPHKFHDFVRHNKSLTKGGFDYWTDDVFDPGSNG